MPIPFGLIKIFKKNALKLRQEFQELNCCNSNDDILVRPKLESCLTISKKLIEYYDEIYSDILNDDGLKHETFKLDWRKNHFVEAYRQYEKSPQGYDIFKIKYYLEFACDYMMEFDSLLHDLNEKVFE